MIYRRNIEKELTEYITSQIASETPPTPHTDLIESKILDSLMMIDLVLYVESNFRIRLNDFEISPVHFRTIDRLTRLVAGKLTNPQDEVIRKCDVDQTRNRFDLCDIHSTHYSELRTFPQDKSAN